MRKLALACGILLLSSPAFAQTTTDTRWNQWLGCWELLTESAGPRATTPSRSSSTRTQATAETKPRVCVEPRDSGVIFKTIVGTQTPIEQTVVADGTERPITDADCRGSQRAEWSGDGRRLFARAELNCANDKGARRVSGIALLATDGTWVDIQGIDVGGRETVRVRRYRRAADQRRPANLDLSPLTLDNVKEAAGKISARTLEAALVETKAGFDLTGKQLLDLDRAGVPDSVVDLIVALSYPKHFVVERTARTDTVATYSFYDPFFLEPFGPPIWSDFYGFYSPIYGPYSSYYYSPFAYAYLRTYNPLFFGSYAEIGSGGGGGSSELQPSGTGRVVDGQGYTRVRARDAEGSSARGNSGSTSTSSSSSGGSSNGSGGSVSTQGFSSGGGGGDGGRTAVPR